ncbi:hypothetical protein KM043_001256 [Ampulex compressa]|nr:hypothetical protein KM043_001256 [Ampulex compressa]
MTLFLWPEIGGSIEELTQDDGFVSRNSLEAAQPDGNRRTCGTLRHLKRTSTKTEDSLCDQCFHSKVGAKVESNLSGIRSKEASLDNVTSHQECLEHLIKSNKPVLSNTSTASSLRHQSKYKFPKSNSDPQNRQVTQVPKPSDTSSNPTNQSSLTHPSDLSTLSLDHQPQWKHLIKPNKPVLINTSFRLIDIISGSSTPVEVSKELNSSSKTPGQAPAQTSRTPEPMSLSAGLISAIRASRRQQAHPRRARIPGT